ncbi:MAG TPA: HAMP domain-containing sensor histidine kinase [Solirubrobacteraceae bacterium]|jgi:two-component system OmpR family sensor kinase|nr:HAMP domain-containing sensor histidine kinase [Solirubrobacteraceae bacterium]
MRARRPLRVGLRWRLAGWVALVVFVCTGAAFVAVYRGTGTQVRHQIDGEIAGDAGGFEHSLLLAHAHSPAQLLRAAESYVHGLPFSASSTFLFATVPGAGTASNRPELLQIAPPDDGESVAEQDQENHLAERLIVAREGVATFALPDVGNLRVLKRGLAVPGALPRGARAVVGVGEPLAPVSRAQRGVARAFVLAGLLALAGALLGAYVIGTRVSRPLRRMAAVAARVDAGDLHPRIEPRGAPGDEVRVLALAFNHMLDRLTAAFAGQRAFVADASHELRTPLTVVAGQLELLAAEEEPSAEDVRRVELLVRAEIARMTRLIDDLLLLAKSEQARFLRVELIDLGAFIQELWHGATLTGGRRFELGRVPAGTLLADPDRLAQALRNLLANAVEHTAPAHGLVRLLVTTGAHGWVTLVVEDDGPGIPSAERERVFDRFHRTDGARDRASGGTGLGLAIVHAIAQAHGGRVSAGARAGGGTRIELQLPGFTRACEPRLGADSYALR